MRIFHIGICATDGGSLPSAFIRNCSEYCHINTGESGLNDKVISIASKFKPDMIFMQIQAPNILHPSTVTTLRSMGAFVINWSGDVREPLPQWYFDMGRVVNLSCFSNMLDVHRLRQFGCNAEYLEIGYDPEIYKPTGDVIGCEEIVFMANNYTNAFPLSGYRIEMVNQLSRHFGSRFGVYGHGWGNKGDFNHSQFEEAKKYRGAKIAINLSHFDVERYASDRLLRILGTGVLCLSHKFNGIEQDYKDGEHLVVWNDFQHLIEKITFYLQNEHHRKAIATAGNELVKNRNTFDHMVKNMIKLSGL